MHMNTTIICAAVLSCMQITASRAAAETALATDIQNIQKDIIENGISHKDLRELAVDIGPRLSGSAAATMAVNWTVAKMQSYLLDRVWKQPVEVPHWVRGTTEKAHIITASGPVPLALAALGRSGGTAGLDAPVIEVRSLDEVRALGEKVRGKIIFYNRPMDPNLPNPFTAYGQAVDQRSSGPYVAAKQGAVAVLVRSMTTLLDDDHPHTGGTSFRSDTTPIPAAALSTHAANVLSKKLKETPGLSVHMELSAQTLPNVISHNVIGEIQGTGLPGEIVLVGGHLDSWDLGQGAHDDGAGVTQSMDVCRTIKRLGLKPRRTIRCVAFMAEEYGGYGGEEYAKQAKLAQEKHVMAIESDRGGFAPQKINIDGNANDIAFMNQYLSQFTSTGIQSFVVGSSGTDVEPLKPLGTLTMELIPDPKHYFDVHHAATDLFAAVNELELKQGSAALASIVYIYANR